MTKLLNVFTFSMIDCFPIQVSAHEITLDEAKALILRGFESFVGHDGAAKMYTAVLGVEVPMNRVSTKLKGGDVALIGQYMGPRLPEGKVLSLEEMKAAPMKWLLVTVSNQCPGCFREQEAAAYCLECDMKLAAAIALIDAFSGKNLS